LGSFLLVMPNSHLSCTISYKNMLKPLTITAAATLNTKLEHEREKWCECLLFYTALFLSALKSALYNAAVQSPCGPHRQQRLRQALKETV